MIKAPNFRLLNVSFLLILISKIYGQQEFKMRYYFSASKFKTANLHRVDVPDNCDITTGYVLQPDGTKFPVHQVTNKQFIQKEIYGRAKGVIDFRDGDTLYFHFWYFKKIKKSIIDTNRYVTGDDGGKDFTYKIDWKKTIKKKGKQVEIEINKFKIPFYFRTLTATYIPFKYDFITQATNGSFLNFNIAHFWVLGNTRFYKNTDIKPRNFYSGMGLFIGGTTVDENSQKLNQFGSTYGASIVFSWSGLNFVGSFGLENSFSSESSKKTHPYIGLGMGYNLVSFFAE